MRRDDSCRTTSVAKNKKVSDSRPSGAVHPLKPYEIIPRKCEKVLDLTTDIA